jgi:glucose/arabinose dehydrogenase/PKD repeat protein
MPTASSRAVPALLGLVLALLVAVVVAPAAKAASYPADFDERTLAANLTMPTGVSWTPDGRMLVAEKSGQLKVVAPGSTVATQIYDIGNKVNAYWDRGLLGVAVDSSFTANHYIYLLYTAELNPGSPDGSGPMVSRLARLTLNPDSSVGTETTILGTYSGGTCPAPSNTLDCLPSEGASHSIGTVRSAPDGTLYVGAGDGSSFADVDPQALRTYNEQSLSGKIMHIDRNGKGLATHPFCASDTNLSDVCTKLYAKGFRNPFRFTLRPSGGLVVGDVGWNTREEVNVISSGGKSYGWPCYEGTIRTPGYQDLAQCAPEYAKEGGANAHVGPAYDYPHPPNSAVIGGPTYTGSTYPASYQDKVFFGDYAAGGLKHMNADGSGVTLFGSGWAGTDIQQDPAGNIAYVSFGTPGSSDGSIREIFYSPTNRSPVAHVSANPTSGPVPLAVAFDASASSDPDGDALTYRWDFGDGATGTGAKPSHTYTQNGTYTAKVTVDDGRGRTDTATTSVSVGNDKPVARILAPVDGSGYRDGAMLDLRGSATDTEDGTLPAAAYAWDVTLHHQDHTHPISQPTGVSSTTFQTATDHDADSFYEITLRVTDSGGQSDTVKSIIRPETVPFGVTSSPAGAPVSYGGRSFTAPYSGTSAIGFKTTVTAADRFNKGGRVYQFSGWSDGGARVHDITVPASASTLTATYADAGPSGPVAALAFDDASGTTARDASGFGNNGTLQNGPTWTTAGKYGGALTFDGVNDRVTIPDADNLDLSTLTLEAWVKPRVRGNWDNILLKEGQNNLAYGMYATGDAATNKPNGAVGDAEVYGTSALGTGAWKHVALTYDGSAMRLYVGGTLVATKTGVSAPRTTDGVLSIGGDAVWADEFFDGQIDELRVYDRALTAAQVTTDMNTRIGSAPADTTAPAVSLTAPAAGASVTGATDVRADASDNVGVQSVQFKLDGANLGAADTSSPYGVTWDTTTASNGSHTLTAVARDAAGNTTTSAARQVTVANQAAGPAPVLALGFNDGSGTTARDASGRGNTGTLSNATWSSAGRYGSALSFNGTNSWVTVADSASLDLTSAYTLEAWVKPSSLTPWDAVLLKEAPGTLSYGLYASADAGNLVPNGWVGFYDVYGTGTPPSGQWTHLALTYDGTTESLYVNGTLVAARPGVPPATASNDPLRIGGDAVWSDEFFNGLIDEVRVYDKALTAAQVSADMQAPITP